LSSTIARPNGELRFDLVELEKMLDFRNLLILPFPKLLLEPLAMRIEGSSGKSRANSAISFKESGIDAVSRASCPISF